MKVLYTSEGVHDFSQRYEGTFGWIDRANASSLMVKLTSVTPNTLTFQDKKNIEYYARADRDVWFSFLPVKKGSYLFHDEIVVVERRPARQWKRGICEENTTIRKLSGEFLPVSFEILQEVFDPSPNYTVQKFRDDGDGGCVLLNNQFSIYKDFVYLYSVLIGRYERGTITLDNDVFLQEIKDICRDKNLSLEVVC